MDKEFALIRSYRVIEIRLKKAIDEHKALSIMCQHSPYVEGRVAWQQFHQLKTKMAMLEWDIKQLVVFRQKAQRLLDMKYVSNLK